jgi:UDP:flavonoid glycosyltransferase YjiC (YdhE family)
MTMRVLITVQPNVGHWHPLVPLAAALAARHEVAFAGTPLTCAALAPLGFACFPAGADESEAELAERRAEQAQRPPHEQAAYMWQAVFAGSRAAGRLPDLLRILREWQPAVVVRDLTELAGAIAADAVGIPQAAVQIVAFRPALHTLVTAQLNRLRASVGLAPADPLAMLYHYLLLSPRPPSFQDPATPLPPTTHAIRYSGFNTAGTEPLPDWIAALPDRPTVYATLGTMQNHHTEIFAAILAALADEPINVIVTVGRNGDPANFGPQPAHIHVARYIPQSLVLPRCAAVIHHGGSGTVMDTLALGLPQVVIPLAADQPPNAESCARLGVARVIAADQRTPAAIRAATRAVLDDPGYRQAAARVQAEMAALPGLDHAVALLERLAAERAPILAEPPPSRPPAGVVGHD